MYIIQCELILRLTAWLVFQLGAFWQFYGLTAWRNLTAWRILALLIYRLARLSAWLVLALQLGASLSLAHPAILTSLLGSSYSLAHSGSNLFKNSAWLV